MNKIMIVEDHIFMRDALKEALEKSQQFTVVAELSDAGLAEMYCTKQQVDLILMDICTENNSSGITATQQIKAHFPAIKVVLMTGLPEMSFVKKAQEAGADSFIYKNEAMDELILTLENVMQGYSSFPVPTPTPLSNQLVRLTDQETEILRMLCAGLSRMEIADALELRESTVKSHIHNMLQKTGHKTSLQLVAFALSEGLVNPKL